jgi:methyl-accepting chemotaxis protein
MQNLIFKVKLQFGGIALVSLLVVGLLGHFWASQLNFPGEQAVWQRSLADALTWLGLLGGLGVALGWGWQLHRAVIKPLQVLTEAGRQFVATDCTALSTALTELARGNLTSTVTLQAQPASPAACPEVRQLGEILAAIISRIQDSARELNVVTDEPCQRLCYVGADSYLEGRACGEAMGQALQGKGKVAIITGAFDSISHGLRAKGFQSLLHEKYPQVQIAGMRENHFSLDTTRVVTQTFLQEYPDLAGVYVTDGGVPFGAAQAVEAAGRGGQVKIVGHDLVDETMRYLQQGIISATASQDPFAQGHDPVIHLFNYLVAGKEPPSPQLLTRIEMITRENYSRFWQPGQGMIETEATRQRLARPVAQKAARPLRIGVLGRAESSFWDPVREGVLAAAAQLKACNVEVQWIVPEAHRLTGESSAAIYGPAIEGLVAQGYHALATGVFDREMSAYINRAVAAGLPVATFNSEPNSLRGLILSLANQANTLMKLSQDLTRTAEFSGQTTAHIAQSIRQVALDTNDQSQTLATATNNIKELAAGIEGISQGAQEQSRAMEKSAQITHRMITAIEQVVANSQAGAQNTAVAAQIASQGATSLESNVEATLLIKNKVSLSAQKVREMGTRSEQIGAIVETIDQIAAQTNLLALNAAIEAARAGEHGRGFAVVADEVRKLAEKSGQSTKEITTLVRDVQRAVVESMGAMNESVAEVESQTGKTEESSQTLAQILQAVANINLQVNRIAQAAQEMNSLSGQLVQATEVMSGVIAENSAVTQDMARGAEEVSHLMTHIAQVSQANSTAIDSISVSTAGMNSQLAEVLTSAHSLSEMAQLLHVLVAQFKLTGD